MAAGNGTTRRARRAVEAADPGEHAGTVRVLGMSAPELDVLTAESEVAALQERIAELEFLSEDAGWQRIDGTDTDLDLAADHLRAVIRDAQIMYLANPLINHAVDVIAVYVFGQGATISGQGAANDRVQAFLEDPGNRRVLTSKAAMLAADRALTYEGNRFFALFGEAGEVTRVRSIPTLQIVAGDIIRNPEDDAEVWYYMRRWVRKGRDPATGKRVTEQRVDYYPDIDYQPESKPSKWGEGTDEGEVHWDSPVAHIKDGGLTGSAFGFPTVYSALTWARAVSRDLSDYATVKRALARFAWKFTGRTKEVAASARARLDSSVTASNPRETNPPPDTASVATLTAGNDLAPIRTAGAAPNPEEGRRLGLMVAAGAGVPETILFGNADAGNLATAKTLDRPTELMMSARQGLWADLLTAIVAYDLRRGSEDGSIPAMEPDPDAEVGEPLFDATTGMAVADQPGMRPVELTPDVSFTDILEDDVTARVSAIVDAATLGQAGTRAGTIPDELLARLLMEALGVEDIDEHLESMFAEPEADPLAGMEDDALAPVADPLAPPPSAERTFAEALDAFSDTLRGPGPTRSRRAREGRAVAAPKAGRG